MKKKFLISGAAVFLAVCLLTSALFAFADSYPVKEISTEDDVVTSISDVVLPSSYSATVKGGKLYELRATSSSFFIFPNYFGFYFSRASSLYFACYNSFPSLGSAVSSTIILVTGVDTGDSSAGLPIYRYSFPSTYPYYAINIIQVYSPPIFSVVNNYISGFFTAAGDFFDGVMSVPILAILVIGVPLTGLTTAITLGLTVGRKKIRSYKKFRRRR